MHTLRSVGAGHARPAQDHWPKGVSDTMAGLPVRKKLRLPDHDYDNGWYFATVCTARRRKCLSHINKGRVCLSSLGETVYRCWRGIDQHFDVVMDACVIMPNHIHGIIYIPGEACLAPTLPNIIGSFKSASTRMIRNCIDPSFAWQRSYYDHVIRNRKDLERIREYIRTNPENWEKDDLFTN